MPSSNPRASADGQEVWLDTTTEVAPFRLILLPLRNKQALLAERGAAKLVTTPADPPMKSFITQVVDGTLGDGGKLEARVKMTFRGDMELLMRTVFRSTPASAWKELLEGIVKSAEISGEVSDWKVSDPAAIREPFDVDFKVAPFRRRLPHPVISTSRAPTRQRSVSSGRWPPIGTRSAGSTSRAEISIVPCRTSKHRGGFRSMRKSAIIWRRFTKRSDAATTPSGHTPRL
jgi:hypothetical protein